MASKEKKIKSKYGTIIATPDEPPKKPKALDWLYDSVDPDRLFAGSSRAPGIGGDSD
jgi:hypothetical protein